MRTPSAVLYPADYAFAFGRASVLQDWTAADAVVVTSGREVHEAIAAAARCRQRGVRVGVVDMPSIDEALLLELLRSRPLVVFAEQNDGYILDNSLKVAYRHRHTTGPMAWDHVLAVNTLGRDGRPWFIHSATYEELVEAYGLSSARLADTICARVDSGGASP
jgi:transketolase C-terminal domain/subunit